VVLLNDVVEISATPKGNRLPFRIFVGEQAQRQMARRIAVQERFSDLTKEMSAR
jgi:hypothetical protein